MFNNEILNTTTQVKYSVFQITGNYTHLRRIGTNPYTYITCEIGTSEHPSSWRCQSVLYVYHTYTSRVLNVAVSYASRLYVNIDQKSMEWFKSLVVGDALSQRWSRENVCSIYWSLTKHAEVSYLTVAELTILAMCGITSRRLKPLYCTISVTCRYSVRRKSLWI